MDFLTAIVGSKPVLIGLHLGFAIIGIDAFFWLLGELWAEAGSQRRMKWAAILGVVTFVLSWLSGGYYYVKFYGQLVKPIIKEGLAPWAHAIFMETKEHIFFFIVPLAVTLLLLALVSKEELKANNALSSAKWLAGLIVFLGLAVGAMGFIVSAAARWG